MGSSSRALLHVSLSSIGGITWEVPSDFCRRRVEGTLTTPDGDPFRQFAVSACTVRQSGFGRLCGGNSVTDGEGRFSLYVPYHGLFFLAPSATRECPNAEDAAHRHELTMEDAYIVGVDWRLPARRLRKRVLSRPSALGPRPTRSLAS